MWGDVHVGDAIDARAVPREANLSDDRVGARPLGHDRRERVRTGIADAPVHHNGVCAEPAAAGSIC